MCGCGTDRWCPGGCECGCDHDTLAGQRTQARHFAVQYQSMRERAADALERGRQAERQEAVEREKMIMRGFTEAPEEGFQW